MKVTLKSIIVGGISLSSFCCFANEEISVIATKEGKSGYTSSASSMFGVGGSFLKTPQSVSTVSQDLMKDQGVTSTKDALRNVAGISFSAGEGGAGQGDNLTLRGFSGRSDFYLDGIRDFGNYTRDSFNLEKIDVIKGPSSSIAGRGSTGGIINQESKMPTNKEIKTVSLTGGTDATRRAVLDFNTKIEGLSYSAFRVNMLSHSSNVAGRDYVSNKRFGFAPSVSFGMGTKSRTNISYLHQSQDDIPDFGFPFIKNSTPVEAQVGSRANYYGFVGNYFKTQVDMLNGKYEYDFSDNSSLTQTVRFGRNQRNFIATSPKTSDSNPTSVSRNQVAINSVESILTSRTVFASDFNTGFVKHNLQTGFEFTKETSNPTRFNYTGVPSTNIFNPTPEDPFSGTASVRTNVHTEANTEAIFLNHTFGFGRYFDLILGGRLDNFRVKYEESIAKRDFSRSDFMKSARSSFVFKPKDNGSFYFNYGTSFNPAAEQFSLSVTTRNLSPEQNKTLEIGTKWQTIDKKLNFSSAIFKTVKTNVFVTNPLDSLSTVSGGEQEVMGFETQLNGSLTDKLQIFTSYAYLDSKIVSSTNLNQIGNRLQNVPMHTFSIWTTYKFVPKFEAGFGANLISRRAASIVEYDSSGSVVSSNTEGEIRWVSGYTTFSAMAKYTMNKKVDMQLNLYNLTNQFYYDQTYPGHVVPGASFFALFTTNIKF